MEGVAAEGWFLIAGLWAKKNEEIRYLRGKSRPAGVAMPQARDGKARKSRVELKLAVFDLQKTSVSRYSAKNRGTIGLS